MHWLPVKIQLDGKSKRKSAVFIHTVESREDCCFLYREARSEKREARNETNSIEWQQFVAVKTIKIHNYSIVMENGMNSGIQSKLSHREENRSWFE